MTSTQKQIPPHVRLFSLLKPEGKDISLIISFSAITGILYLATPLAADAVVQNIAFGGQQQVYLQTLLIFSFALLTFLILLSLISATQHYVAELIQQRIFVRLAADLSFRLPRLKYSSWEQSRTQELINRFLDVSTLQKSSAMILLDGINVVLSSGFGMLVLAFYHPFLLAFDVILVTGLLIILFPMGRHGVKTSIRESYAKHAVAGWLEQMVLFPILFKTPSGKQLSLERSRHFVDEYLAKRKAHYRVLIRQILGLLGMQAVASAGLLAVGGALVLSGELTLGQLVASELIVSAIVAALVGLGKHIEIWYDALAATDKLGTLVDLPIERETGESVDLSPGPLSFQFQDVEFGFREPLFVGFNLSIRAGESVGISGSLGSGSGRLLDLAYGLRSPNKGTVLVNQRDLRLWHLDTIRSGMNLMRQTEIFEGSIAENVRLANHSISLDEVRQHLNDVGLLERIRQLPDGIDTLLQTGGRPLSRGENQLLCLARVLVSKPQAILLDKVLDGLDDKQFSKALETLFHPDAPWTLVIASRDPQILRRCNRIINLDQQSPSTSAPRTER
jgi:putative ABC transport system ATP-binding protein